MKLVVALDFSDEKSLFHCLEGFRPEWAVLKVGLEAYTALGPEVVRKLVQQNYQVFLDLKFHDIPNTVARACQAAADLGVFMLNVHASGGLPMLEAARTALSAHDSPYLIAVTVLTSQAASTSQVQQYAKDAFESGLDGVVCSALEAPTIKSAFGQDFLAVTPGIRLPGDDHQDQVRVVTPENAKAKGSDYAVIGRSITQSKYPAVTLKMIYDSIQA